MDVCGRCAKEIYPQDLKRAAKKTWHNWCFRCKDCNATLTLGKVARRRRVALLNAASRCGPISTTGESPRRRDLLQQMPPDQVWRHRLPRRRQLDRRTPTTDRRACQSRDEGVCARARPLVDRPTDRSRRRVSTCPFRSTSTTPTPARRSRRPSSAPAAAQRRRPARASARSAATPCECAHRAFLPRGRRAPFNRRSANVVENALVRIKHVGAPVIARVGNQVLQRQPSM